MRNMSTTVSSNARRLAATSIRDIRRAHSLGELTDDSLGACDALVAWYEMKIDAGFVSTLRSCRIIVRLGVGFDHIDLATAAREGFRFATRPTMAPARSPIMPSD
jgi:phosphoglycerate dehydrogenase-like enzyme